jgi:pimeloyl-ACP methyl ester carboxylesterase
VFMREEVFNTGTYRCRVIYYQEPGIPVILLHGYSFTSVVWRDIGLLELLEKNRIPFLAIDMPYGARSACSPRNRDPDENVNIVYEGVRAYFGTIDPVIIGASLGGYIALKYAIRYPVSGLLLIGPVHLDDQEITRKYKDLRSPVLVILGSMDDVVDHDRVKKFVKETRYGELKVYENARHAAYLDKPGDFRRDVLGFYNSVLSKR